MPIYERKEVADALMHPEDRSVEYRGNILPLLRRAVTDPYDDISEYEQIELAVPGMIRDPFLGMAALGQMARGKRRFNPDEVTQTALDVGLLSAPLGLMGSVPRGAVLGANVGGRKSPTAALPGLLDDTASSISSSFSRVRDRLSDDRQAAIVQAANTAHKERLDLARSVHQFDDKFDLDQMLVDNDLAVEVDGFVQEGNVFLNDIDIPAGAKEGDILPISAVKKGARLGFPDGSEKDFSPNPGGPFRSDDLGVELINLDEDGFANIVLRDRNAVESRILADTVAEDAVTTLEDALGHPDHHARAAAFRKILDELGIEYNKAGIEGVNSEYVYVPTKWDVDGDAVEDLLKIRFADHTRQSGLHEPADYNIADGGYDDAISALDDIVQKISGVRTEMFSNPVTAAVPGLLSQQELKNSEDQADTINLLSQMLQNKTPIAQKRHWGAYLGEV
jgi:hypothetical protein